MLSTLKKYFDPAAIYFNHFFQSKVFFPTQFQLCPMLSYCVWCKWKLLSDFNLSTIIFLFKKIYIFTILWPLLAVIKGEILLCGGKTQTETKACHTLPLGKCSKGCIQAVEIVPTWLKKLHTTYSKSPSTQMKPTVLTLAK